VQSNVYQNQPVQMVNTNNADLDSRINEALMKSQATIQRHGYFYFLFSRAIKKPSSGANLIEISFIIFKFLNLNNHLLELILFLLIS
jgi:hypothetical protein